jgi:hypothetical protein
VAGNSTHPLATTQTEGKTYANTLTNHIVGGGFFKWGVKQNGLKAMLKFGFKAAVPATCTGLNHRNEPCELNAASCSGTMADGSTACAAQASTCGAPLTDAAAGACAVALASPAAAACVGLTTGGGNAALTTAVSCGPRTLGGSDANGLPCGLSTADAPAICMGDKSANGTTCTLNSGGTSCVLNDGSCYFQAARAAGTKCANETGSCQFFAIGKTCAVMSGNVSFLAVGPAASTCAVNTGNCKFVYGGMCQQDINCQLMEAGSSCAVPTGSCQFTAGANVFAVDVVKPVATEQASSVTNLKKMIVGSIDIGNINTTQLAPQAVKDAFGIVISARLNAAYCSGSIDNANVPSAEATVSSTRSIPNAMSTPVLASGAAVLTWASRRVASQSVH